MNNFKKIAKEREKRAEKLYEMEDTYEAFTPVCPDHPGVRRLRVSDDEKVKLGYIKGDMVWKCPEDGKVYGSKSSVADQTDGFSLRNNLTGNKEPMTEDDFGLITKLRKMINEK